MLQGKLQFFNQKDNVILAELDVRKTENFVERTRGLLKTDSLLSTQALWITPCNSVHTFGMKYPIDVIYLDAGQCIRSIRTNLKPTRISFNILSKSVIEIKAGMATQLGLSKGDKIVFEQD